MKKIIITCLLVFLTISAFAQKNIEKPVYDFSYLPGEITKIELLKDATILHFHIKYRAGSWIYIPKESFIKGVDTKENLFVVKAEGIPLAEKYYMPDSGEVNYKLYFPKLDSNIDTIDFGEANEGGSWAIYNISLDTKKQKLIPDAISNWLEQEIAKSTKKPIEDYNSPEFFNKTPAKLIGYIRGYSDRLGFNTGIMYTDNVITREDYPVVIPVQPDGRFEAEIPLTNPSYTYIVFKNKIVRLYLEPGQTLSMVIGNDISFMGSIAKVNEDLSGYDKKEFNYNLFQNKIKELTPEEFKKEQLATQKQNTERLERYFDNNNISSKAKTILKNENSLETASMLFDFVMNRDYAAKKDSINSVLKISETDDYYDFLQELDLNDQSLLVVDKFSTFINRFEFSNPILVYPKQTSRINNFKPEKTLFEYFDEAGIVLSDTDKELIKDNTKKTFKSIEEYNKYMEAFSEDYRKGVKAYNEKYIQPFINVEPKEEKISMEKWRLRDSVVSNTFHLKKNLVYDVVKIRALDFDITRANSENAHEYWRILKKDIENPFLKKEGDRIVNKKFPVLSTQINSIDGASTDALGNIQPQTAIKLPKGLATNVFKDIIDPFKGKILFVDFWATTCGPCVASIERMKQTRKKHEGNKDFDFIFITDERGSPIGKYNEFVKEQDLKNIYRLSTDDYNYLRQLFKFNGIPKYVVIDKNGDVINEDFPMHNFNFELDKILAASK
ncbi:TlpA family protein disulfide reductase [Confluentibacter sediminis]|uniref:TlpA family protein disulfide reductase n=1 Tax=Confluentibacter sediminis TaxID=2219045 RepID=UPI000DAC1A28|nr:TlpA disulfide reductase family protein [Confluentibacter sediminis]